MPDITIYSTGQATVRIRGESPEGLRILREDYIVAHDSSLSIEKELLSEWMEEFRQNHPDLTIEYK